MKKKLLTLTMALALTLALAVPAFAVGFDDVKDGDYFAAPVNWAVEQNVTKGTSETKFSPEETCTRAQIITFLWRAAGSPTGATAEITDVSSEDYYYDAVLWAKEMKMVEGDAFMPNDPCTRQMAVEFIWMAAGSPEADGEGFDDAKGDAINWAVAAGVTTGTTPTTFSPDETCTRGQIVTFLYRAFADEEQKAADAAAAEQAAAEKAEAEKAEAEKAAAEQAEAEKAEAEKAEGEATVQTGLYVCDETGVGITIMDVTEQILEFFINDMGNAMPINGNVAEDEEFRITFGDGVLTLEILNPESVFVEAAGEYEFVQALADDEK